MGNGPRMIDGRAREASCGAGKADPIRGARCVYGRQRRVYRDWTSALGEIEVAILRIGGTHKAI